MALGTFVIFYAASPAPVDDAPRGGSAASSPLSGGGDLPRTSDGHAAA